MKSPNLDGVRVYTKEEHRERSKTRSSIRSARKPPKRKFETVLDSDLVNEKLKDRMAVTLYYSDRDFFRSLGDGSVSRGIHIAAGLAQGRLDDISIAVLASKAITIKENR